MLVEKKAIEDIFQFIILHYVSVTRRAARAKTLLLSVCFIGATTIEFIEHILHAFHKHFLAKLPNSTERYI